MLVFYIQGIGSFAHHLLLETSHLLNHTLLVAIDKTERFKKSQKRRKKLTKHLQETIKCYII